MSVSAACGAAVKADGYGIGARQTVRHLGDAGCRDFFVATWAEEEEVLPHVGEASLSVLHGLAEDDIAHAAASRARPVLNTPLAVTPWGEHGKGRTRNGMDNTRMT